MDPNKKQNLLQAIRLIQESLEETGDFSLEKSEPKRPEKKKEQRIELDKMDAPPISEPIMTDISNCVEMLTKEQRGNPINCVIIGEYTGMLSSVVSDSFGGPGGRVLCIGDCVDSDGHPKQEWVEYVGERFQKTVWPVKGDVADNFQGMEKRMDMAVLSTCGSYSDMASLITKWSGLVRPGGVVCGTQLDKEDYPASTQAIYEVFGEEVESEHTSFWFTQPGLKASK